MNHSGDVRRRRFRPFQWGVQKRLAISLFVVAGLWLAVGWALSWIEFDV